MRKDLSQPLERALTAYELLVQDCISKRFFTKTEEGDDDDYDCHPFSPLPSFTSEPFREFLPLRLIKELSLFGFTLNTYRKLCSITDVVYTYVDDTPGVVGDTVCLYIAGDLIHDRWHQQQPPGQLLLLEELVNHKTFSFSQIAWYSLQQLVADGKQNNEL